MTSNGLPAIEALLARRLGLDPSSLGPGMIPRAVKSRMKVVGLGDVSEYETLARGSEAELQELIEEVVVPESWFFRDVLPFRFLRDYVRSGWVARPHRGPIRVVSLPCAGGEEPYSIAIALDDVGMPAERCRIDAVDVSAVRLAQARRGVYSRNALRGLGADVVARRFHETPEGFRVVDSIRGRVSFRQGNLLDPRLLADQPPYDVVFCRNVLIYLNAESRTAAAANLDRLLAPGGVLIVGHADPLGPLAFAGPSRLVLAAEPGAFAYHRRAEAALPSPAAPPALAPPPPVFRSREPAPPAPPIPIPPPAPVPPASVEPEPRPLLEQASEHANRGRHGQALACCEAEIRRAGPTAAALALMGGIHQAAGRRSQAEECFHKAIYLDPQHDEALLALALIAERRGDQTAASGFRRRADRALKTKGASTHE